PIAERSDETWQRVNAALHFGLRGLPGGSSLAKTLDEHRGVRNIQDLPDLQIAQIVEWAKSYHHQNHAWPTYHSGEISDEPGETWMAVRMALVKGRRGLPGGSSLARILDEHCRKK